MIIGVSIPSLIALIGGLLTYGYINDVKKRHGFVQIADDLKEGVLEVRRNEKNFLDELKLLKAKTPNYIPRSSTSVDQAVRLIKKLLEKNYAYWHGNNVYYDPLKFKDFGKLYGLDMSRWPKTKRRWN